MFVANDKLLQKSGPLTIGKEPMVLCIITSGSGCWWVRNSEYNSQYKHTLPLQTFHYPSNSPLFSSVLNSPLFSPVLTPCCFPIQSKKWDQPQLTKPKWEKTRHAPSP